MVGAEEKAGGPDLASSHVPYRTSSPSAPQALGLPGLLSLIYLQKLKE